MEVHLGYCVLTLKYDAFEKLEKNSFDKSELLLKDMY